MDVDTTQDPPRTPASRMALLELREAAILAAEAVASARRGSVDARTLVTVRRDHVQAMAAYERALVTMGLPVPRQLRDTLRLERRVVALSDRLSGQ